MPKDPAPKVTPKQVIAYRLQVHNLADLLPKTLDEAALLQAVGVCGLQNSPPGAWQTAVFNRLPNCTKAQLHTALYQHKSLLQAWSLRGVPLIFPTAEAAAYLAALQAQPEEQPWIYTRGITLALDYLQMSFAELLPLVQAAAHYLDKHTIVSKEKLDSTLAELITPQLPAEKQQLWQAPSMYDQSGRQTVGGAVVSFLLRPCAWQGLVVFGQRQGGSPSFTSYQSWLGQPWPAPEPEAAGRQLVHKFLHCYGPSNQTAFNSWLGCSPRQGKRLWQSVGPETTTVELLGKKYVILHQDLEPLLNVSEPEPRLLLLGPHDPYLEQRDRSLILPDASLHKTVWRTVGNPGVILRGGQIIGVWQHKGREINLQPFISLNPAEKQQLNLLAEALSQFQNSPA